MSAHRCRVCGGEAAAFVAELESGVPVHRDYAICNRHGAQALLDTVRGIVHG